MKACGGKRSRKISIVGPPEKKKGGGGGGARGFTEGVGQLAIH